MLQCVVEQLVKNNNKRAQLIADALVVDSIIDASNREKTCLIIKELLNYGLNEVKEESE